MVFLDKHNMKSGKIKCHKNRPTKKVDLRRAMFLPLTVIIHSQQFHIISSKCYAGMFSVAATTAYGVIPEMCNRKWNNIIRWPGR